MAKKQHNVPSDDGGNGSAAVLDPQGNMLLPATDGNGEGAKPKPAESKAERWIRLANRRVPKLLKAIRHVANLASRSQYEYTAEQVAILFGKLDAELSALQVAYHKIAAEHSAAETQLF